MELQNNSAGTENTNNSLDDLECIGTVEVARLLGCSVPTAREIMRRKDFPLLKVGKNCRVMKSAFIKWASQRRV